MDEKLDGSDYLELFVIILFMVALVGVSFGSFKEDRKSQEEINAKINKCLEGKVISKDEANTTITVYNEIGRIGRLPGFYEQTVVVPQYYVNLDNGISLVSKDPNLKMYSVVGQPIRPEFCDEDYIR